MWDSMSVNQKFFKPLNNGAGRGLTSRKGKPMPEYMSLLVSLNCWLLQSRRATEWLVNSLTDSNVMGAVRWFLLITGWMFDTGNN